MAHTMTPEMRAATDRAYRINLFDGKCPYTNDPCDNWDCENCEFEAEEREWMEALDQEEQVEIEVEE